MRMIDSKMGRRSAPEEERATNTIFLGADHFKSSDVSFVVEERKTQRNGWARGNNRNITVTWPDENKVERRIYVRWRARTEKRWMTAVGHRKLPLPWSNQNRDRKRKQDRERKSCAVEADPNKLLPSFAFNYGHLEQEWKELQQDIELKPNDMESLTK